MRQRTHIPATLLVITNQFAKYNIRSQVYFFLASELTTTTGRDLQISAPIVGSRLTFQISPRLIFINEIPRLPGMRALIFRKRTKSTASGKSAGGKELISCFRALRYVMA